MPDHILYGSAYYYEYLPCERMEEDFRMMTEAGFNLIRVAESTWSTWEPADGVFDFSMLHRVLKAASRYGLSVIVGTPTYAIPPWLAGKYPDILSETHSGICRYGPRQNFDLTHPGYRFHAERVIRRLMEEVREYDCVVGFQLDNETKPYDTCSPRAQKLFQEWLRERFETPQELNREMGFAYWSNSIHEWEDLPDVRGTINGSFGAEYQAFQRHLVTEFLSWQRAIVDEYRRPEQFVTHNFDFGWRLYSHGLQPDADQFDAARAVTVAGCDIYHPSQDRLTGAEIAFGGALARALKQDNYLVLETQAQGNLGWLPYPGQLRLQAFSHLASGADGISYWHWHSTHNAIESYWKGVLSHDFSAGAVYQEAATIGRDLARLSGQLLHLKKKNRVAVMVSNRSLTGFTWFPTCQAGDTPPREYNDYLRWVCDALYHLNLEYDIINDDFRDFSRYDLIVLPSVYAMPDDLPNALRQYTEGGGHILATFRTAFADPYLKIRHDAPPHGLTDVFGLTYDRFTRPEQVRLQAAPALASQDSGQAARDFGQTSIGSGQTQQDFSRASQGSGQPSQDSAQAPLDCCQTQQGFGQTSFGSGQPSQDFGQALDWIELLSVSTAEPLLTYVHPAWQGIPAVTRNHYGKGQAVYVGCFMEQDAFEQLLSMILPDMGIPLSGIRFPLIIRTGRNTAGDTVTYYFNYSGQPRELPPLPADGQELLAGSPVSAGEQLRLEPWDVKIISAAYPGIDDKPAAGYECKDH